MDPQSPIRRHPAPLHPAPNALPELDSNLHARRLFGGIAHRYDFLYQALSFGQGGVWQRFLVSRIPAGVGDKVLDICTGTARVATDLTKASGARVVGVDLSPEMLAQGQRNISRAGLSEKVGLVMGRAEDLSFGDKCFDAVCFTYLLRYVDDPRATLGEIIRVLKPGGTLAALEFCVPEGWLPRLMWQAYTRLALPSATRLVSPGWRYVGRFLGPSISRFYKQYPLQEIRQMWVEFGISNVQVKKLSFGGGVVMWGTKD